MTDRTTCPECGAPVPEDAPGGACPGCLLAVGLDDTDLSGIPTRGELEAAFPSLEIGEMLGRGGMGAVFQARQRSLDRQVALKVLPLQDPGAAEAFAVRFEREARALARLDHPNIVRVYEFGEEGGLHYLLMEYVDGVNLRDAMEAGEMSPQQALAVIPQICDALQFAHDQGVVHRDIKPENVLLSKEGAVKVADFGLAKLVTGSSSPDPTLTRAGQVMGTLHYMAPEQIESPSSVDHRADIYSLGVVFYELLTGDLPLGRFEAPSERVHVDVRLDEVVLRALEKKRERRYQRADDVKTAVSAISDAGDGKPRAPRRKPRVGDRMRARHHGDKPRWWEVEKELGIDWHEYSLRTVAGFALLPVTILAAVTVGLGIHSTTGDLVRAYSWTALVLGLGVFCSIVFAISGLSSTARGKRRKGRFLAVFTLVFSFVAVPISLWAAYWLLDIPNASMQQYTELGRYSGVSPAIADPNAVNQQSPFTGPDGWPVPPGARAGRRNAVHADPDFVLTDSGDLPIPQAAGDAIKARLTYLLGAAARFAGTEPIEYEAAKPLIEGTATHRLDRLSEEEWDAAAGTGSLGLAFLKPATLPVPLEEFRLVSAHVDKVLGSEPMGSKWHCGGTATARSAEWELTFRFEQDPYRVVLSVDPIGWTRLPAKAVTVPTQFGRLEARPTVFDWTGARTPVYPPSGDPYSSMILETEQLMRVLAKRAKSGTFEFDDALRLIAPSVHARLSAPAVNSGPNSPEVRDQGLPVLVASLGPDDDRTSAVRTELDLASVVEVHLNRDETGGKVIARSARFEFVFRIVQENDLWYFGGGEAVIRALEESKDEGK